MGVKTKRERTPVRSRAHRLSAQAETTRSGFSRPTIFQGLLRSASRPYAPEAIPMQSFMAVPVDVCRHGDYPIAQMCWQVAVVLQSLHVLRNNNECRLLPQSAIQP